MLSRGIVYFALGLAFCVQEDGDRRVDLPDSQPSRGSPTAKSIFKSTPADSESGVSEKNSDDNNDDDPQDVDLNEGDSGRWNVPLKTTGGTQFWTDHIHRGGDRLQQHSLTKHWRLLDQNDIRRAWGTRDQCLAVLDERKSKSAIGQGEHVIVLLHGLMRTRFCMKTLETRFHDAGYRHTFRFSYASTRASIGDHAAALREALEDFPADTTFSFVGHSMGNIVVRRLIGDLDQDGDPMSVLARCKSMVMLGPPNQGAAISRRLAPTGVYELLTGKGGMELGPEWDKFAKRLGTPKFPFAIVAGDVSANRIQNPLVDGSSDFVVSLEEADLEGRVWLRTVPALHSFLMNDPTAMAWTVEFVQSNP